MLLNKDVNYTGQNLMVANQYRSQVLPHQHNRYVLFNQDSGYDHP
ncbi:hypothetical protein ACFOEW_05475 [Alteromonas oceani]|uniref:Uncharacterized protein n=1 Tax=Alteromonas oceani TaxID=2071609 RepID=A0ABV7JTI8_9ALTE|nr:hypothetical protein [Alteromonas oceani]